MEREWALRRRLAEGISTPALEDLLRLARDQGAWGGKACGAGGGGCLALLCPPERKSTIARRLEDAGAEVLPALPAADGLRIEDEAD
jgi:D-glycero-alpha-D-manno-heptose-7-phosphate kinase